MTQALRSVYVGVRLEADLVDRLDQLAQGTHGLKVPRSEVVRLAITKGLTILEKENKAKRK